MGSGWTLVGEQGPELISPSKWVLPASQTKSILSRGHVPGSKRAIGGPLTGSSLIGLDTGELLFGSSGLPVTSGNIGNTTTSTSTSGGGSSSIAAVIAAPIAAAVVEPVISGISMQVERQSVILTSSVNKMVAENRNIASKLDTLIATVSTNTGVARAVTERRSLTT